MDNTSPGKQITGFSIRYNANNEVLEELKVPERDLLSPQLDNLPPIEAPTKKPEKSSILDKYFKTPKVDKVFERFEEIKKDDVKKDDDTKKESSPKEVTSSPVKDYLNRLKRGNNADLSCGEVSPKQDSTETWKIFQEFKSKFSQAVEDMKASRNLDDKEKTQDKDKSIARDSSVSDSEDTSLTADHSVGDTDYQVSSLESSMNNLSEATHAVTTRAADTDYVVLVSKANDSGEDTSKNMESAPGSSKHSADENVDSIESGIEAMEDNISDNEAFENQDPVSINSYMPEQKISPSIDYEPSEADANFDFVNAATVLSAGLVFFSSVVFSIFSYVTVFFLGMFLFNVGSTVFSYVLIELFGPEKRRKKKTVTYETRAHIIEPVKGQKHVTYEGWINHYRFPNYDPYSYRINRTTTAYMQLEGCSLRISYTRMKVAKRALWDEEIGSPSFYQHRLYNLKGARLLLLPKGLVRRRLWSKKYPICIVLSSEARVELLQKESDDKDDKKETSDASQSTENTKSRKKFIWRRRDKPLTSDSSMIDSMKTDLSPGREGLRHRIARKMHKERRDSNPILDKTILEKKNVVSEKSSSPEKTLDTTVKQEAVDKTRADSEPVSQSHLIEPEKPVEVEPHLAEAPPEPANTLEPKGEPKGASELESIKNEAHTKQIPDYSSQEVFYKPSLINPFDYAEVLIDIEDPELLSYKKFLDSHYDLNEEAISDAEWSLQYKDLKESTKIFIFTRTGRDKHEWYRRLNKAIADSEEKDVHDEATSTVDGDRSAESAPSAKNDGSSVAFNKQSGATIGGKPPSVNEPVTVKADGTEDELPQTVDPILMEADFWKFILKVVLKHDPLPQQMDTSKVATVCNDATKEKGTKKKDCHRKSCSKDKKDKHKCAASPMECGCNHLNPNLMWLNACIARMVYDGVREPRIVKLVQARVQKKLNTIKLPSFMSSLVATELTLGGTSPLIAGMSGPTTDERGLWIDAHVIYEGGVRITLMTQINLMKLKDKKYALEEQMERIAETSCESDFDVSSYHSQTYIQRRRAAMFDSEAEDSAESSTDDEVSAIVTTGEEGEQSPLPGQEAEKASPSGTKKFLRIVDKITTSKYFHQVADYKIVKRAMEGLSNTDLKLQVEMCALEGDLVINVPPPPHDRIWIGFRTNPRLSLKAKPAVGTRAVRFAHITNWIENKLCKEFEKILVLPNMEDIIIDTLSATPYQSE